MRKLLAIFFLLLLTLTTEPGIQIMKLPLLLNHFATHLTERRSNSFTGFLKQHYSSFHHSDSDSRQDEQLPFKTVSAEAFTSLYVSSFPAVELIHSSAVKFKPVLSPYQFSLQDHMKGIFHPPKNA